MKRIIIVLAVALPFACWGQYAPPAGQPGSTAIYKDSSAFVAWATKCHINRGYQNISDTTLGKASTGDSTMALGKAMANGVVSLGDGGSAVLHFNKPIFNGPSYDFAVFENGFGDYFLELAFVEVSSDNIHFFRFPSVSLTDTTAQVNSFDSLQATKLYDLAGKYRGGYGTPFDLSELPNSPYLNKDSIVAVKVIDVVGCLQNQYATHDSQGHKVNDPWPTAFPSSGFDLDAVGVIHQKGVNSIAKNDFQPVIHTFPNPTSGNLTITTGKIYKALTIKITDITGRVIATQKISGKQKIEINFKGAKGIYFVQITTASGKATVAKVIKE